MTAVIAIVVGLVVGVIVWGATRRVLAGQFTDELEAAKAEGDDLRAERDALREKHAALQLENAEIKATQAAAQQNQALMATEFENLANKILEDKAKSFKETSSESINTLLAPMKTQMKEFREKVESIHTQDTKQQAEMGATIKLLMEQNSQLSEDASALTTALRGEHRTQGVWGELQLERVLEASGLTKGKEYDTQKSYRGSEGNLLRPDAVVHLPESKHLIIDAKTSLTAFVRCVEAETEEEAKAALDEHAQAVEDRVNELAGRGYNEIPDLNSPEFVFLFVPSEPALQAALQHNEKLLGAAMEQKVYIVSPTTLLPSLLIVAQLWRIAAQGQNTLKIVETANGLLDQIRLVVEAMGEVGERLGRTQESYDTAMKRLHSGRGNLMKKAADFEELGVEAKKALAESLPDELLTRGKLEIGELDIAPAIALVENNETATSRETRQASEL